MKHLTRNIIVPAILAAFLIVISEIYNNHYMSNVADSPISYLFSFVVCTVVICVLSIVLCSGTTFAREKIITVSSAIDQKVAASAKKIITIIYVVITIIVYFVCFFAYYPGTAAYDYKTCEAGVVMGTMSGSWDSTN